MHNLIKAALIILIIGLFNSISLMAVFHILMIIPIVYFIYKRGLKDLPNSTFALLAFCIVAAASVIFNQDVINNGYKNIFKLKYFIIGSLSIVPLTWFFNDYLRNDRKRFIKILVNLFFISLLIATTSGLIGFYTGFNPLKYKVVDTYRNKGMFGMIMTYGYQASFAAILLAGFMNERKNLADYYNKPLLYITSIINILGLFLSYTRGALLGFIAGLFMMRKKVALITIAVFVIGGGVVSLVNPIFIKNEVIRKGSNDKRMTFWKASLYAFKERPLLGYGYKNFESNSKKIKEKYDLPFINNTGHSHNNFLQILSTTGVLGFVLYLLWLVLWIFESIKSDTVVSRIGFLFIVTFIIGGMTQSTIIDGENLFFIFAVYAVSSIRSNKVELSAQA